MELDKRLWIFAYKMGSKSAQALADELDVYILKHEGSNFHGAKGKYILNWGAGTGVFNADARGATIFNTPAQIDVCVNKLVFFEKVMGKCRIPVFTQRADRAEAWVEMGHTVIARTELEGAKGSGLVVVKNPGKLPHCHLYTLFQYSDCEYRLYMFDGKVVGARIKLPGAKVNAMAGAIRIDDNGWEFCKVKGGLANVPKDCIEQAEKATKAVGLFTGGVDVLWDGRLELATVLEMNTAPYVGGDTAAVYAKLFKNYLDKVA